MIKPEEGKLIHPDAESIIRLAEKAESDNLLAPHSSGLRGRFYARTFREFFNGNLRLAGLGYALFYEDVNLIAHWANLGYLKGAEIHDHILQSLIFHTILYDHQADALIILFKLAGEIFGKYANKSLVADCFGLLEGHEYYDKCRETAKHAPPSTIPLLLKEVDSFDRMKKKPVQVRAPRPAKTGYQTTTNFQEVVELRKGWKGAGASDSEHPTVPTAAAPHEATQLIDLSDWH